MTDDEWFTRNSPAWQRHQAARTLADHAKDTADLTELLDMLGLTAVEGREPPAEQTAPEPVIPPAPLTEGTSERLGDLLRDVLPSAHRPIARHLPGP